MRLLHRFSSSLLSAEYSSAADVPPNLRVFSRKVELSFDILKQLQEGANYALTGRNTPLVCRKRGKSATSNRRIDPLPFNSMGITVPSTDAEVHGVYVQVLSQLRSILEVCGFITDSLRIELKQPQNYLLILRKPTMSQIFESVYTKVNLSSEGEPHQSRDPAFFMVQLMKAALYFDNIEEFGEWSILLSTRAQKDLRDVKRADSAMFQMVMKKIK